MDQQWNGPTFSAATDRLIAVCVVRIPSASTLSTSIAAYRLLHALLKLSAKRDIEGHPKLGASWEGFIIDQLVQQLGANPEATYHWRTHQGAELDLLVVRGGLRLGSEVKRTVAPTLTPSMRSAMHDLRLKSLTVVHAGEQTFPLSKQVQAVAFRDVLNAIRPLH